MLNHIVLMGRLTRDPELRHTVNGNAVASFAIACERDFASNGGEKDVDFIDVVAWRSTADFVTKYFSKGRMAVISGRLQMPGEWTHRNLISPSTPTGPRWAEVSLYPSEASSRCAVAICA